MLKLVATSAIAILLGVASAAGQTATGHKRAEKAPSKPTAEETAIPPDPVAMQKWFGQAVGNILDGANRTLTGQPAPGR